MYPVYPLIPEKIKEWPLLREGGECVKCTVCEREFETARSDAKFCSGACRKVNSRLSVTGDVTDNGENVTDKLSVTVLDFRDDLKLDLVKDLGVTSWDANGIFISPDITTEQVRRIRRLVEAKNGCEPREYRD